MTDTQTKLKVARITSTMKLRTAVITSMISLLGTLVVIYLQQYSAKESSVQVVVDQINDKILPRLQDVLHELTQENKDLISRVARLEGIEEGRSKHATVSEPKPPRVKPEPKPFDNVIVPTVITPEDHDAMYKVFIQQQRVELPKIQTLEEVEAEE